MPKDCPDCIHLNSIITNLLKQLQENKEVIVGCKEMLVKQKKNLEEMKCIIER